MTLEERVSRLEGAFEQFPGRIDALENSLRAEIRASISALENGLRAEIRAFENGLRAEIKASENGLRAEIKGVELRTTLWLGGFIFSAAALAVAAVKLLP